MTRRRLFDPASVPQAFWQDQGVQVALARRDVAELFRLYLDSFADCTQTQLALVTEHDRSDISNWLRGARQAQVSDIDVLTRIAEGLCMPDESRVLMGLAPANAVFSSIRAERALDAHARWPNPEVDAARSRLVGSAQSSHRIAICGSRAPGTDARSIDAAVRSLARLVITRNLLVNHGPVGVGLPSSGGTARTTHERLRRDESLRTRLLGSAFAEIDRLTTLDEAALDSDVEAMTDDFVRVLDGLVTMSTKKEPNA